MSELPGSALQMSTRTQDSCISLEGLSGASVSFLPKPVLPSRLLEAVRRLLDAPA